MYVKENRATGVFSRGSKFCEMPRARLRNPAAGLSPRNARKSFTIRRYGN